MDSVNGGHYPTSFKDSTGETWTLILNLPAIRRASARTGYVLPNLLSDPELMQKFNEDMYGAASDCLVEILQPRLTDLGISEAEFLSRFTDEEQLQDAMLCLVRSLINFSQQREMLGPAFEKSMAAANKLRTKAMAELQSKIEKTDWDAAATGSISASSSPESAESIPTDSASENST